MTPEQKKMLRDSLVAALVAASTSLPVDTLRMAARAAGFKVENDALLPHLDYLVKKGFATAKPSELSAGVTRWESTADAVDYAEANGLA